jgi:peptide/nickel transport system substrate-binding protein
MQLCTHGEGEVDIISDIRPLDTLKVAKSPYAKIVKKKDFSQFLGMFNQRKRDSKWRDIRLRKALNYAVNRKELKLYAAKGNAHSLGLVLSPSAYNHDPDMTPYTYDARKAETLLREAGYPEGFEMTVIVAHALELEGRILCKMWERIGLKVNLEVLTWPEWQRQYNIPLLGKPPEDLMWDIALVRDGDWHGHPAASFLSYGLLEGSNMRWVQYDSSFEETWRDMARTMDKERHDDLVKTMVKYVHDQAIRLQIYSPIRLYAVNNEVEFIPEMMPYLRLKDTSVTENHWSVRGKNN